MIPVLSLNFPPPLVFFSVISNVLELLFQVVDMGCAELCFFPFLKHLPGVIEVIALDVDNQLLESFAHRSAPLLSDHLVQRASPLHVLVLSGSITQHDYRLRDCDVVVAIELIEHLYPQELEEFPFTVFGYIQPNVAIITTPNADFNILFGNLRGFRHSDHKFEWTRMQFQDCFRALNITKRYPDYEVTFQGIGQGPFGSEFLGCCSQMAVFSRMTPKRGSDNDQKEMGEIVSENNEISRNLEVYQIVAQYNYPIYEDNRTETQRIQDDLSITIKNLALRQFERKWNLMHSVYEDLDYEECDEDIYLPFEDIIKGMVEAKLTESELRQLLDGSEWNVKEVNGKFVVHYPDPGEDNSSLPEDEEEEEERAAEMCKRDPEPDSDWDDEAAEKCARETEADSDWEEENVETCTRGTEDDSDWDHTVAEEKASEF
ncbi:hypothetical protein J437_LFUL002947 [Ladona fulva]|uniref:Small RNA 2'-O-methyltransferase n=1 Tax=Ladona fulva TaxID=123851 RepID=A0A8K0P093_LADFU|nr:hypothetical protein J437_LFUL002947 [Ladona fulva]